MFVLGNPGLRVRVWFTVRVSVRLSVTCGLRANQYFGIRVRVKAHQNVDLGSGVALTGTRTLSGTEPKILSLDFR